MGSRQAQALPAYFQNQSQVLTPTGHFMVITVDSILMIIQDYHFVIKKEPSNAGAISWRKRVSITY
jgi:hypothetical protein